jgi:hypothetical protein
MVCLHFYEALDDGPRFDRAEIEDYLSALNTVELSGARGEPYRSGRWRDLETGANCDLDIGTLPIEEDHLHPPTAYDGWRDIGLTIHVPLAGPHWLCVETLQWVERLLQEFPQLKALDTEDTKQDHGDGPGMWHRPRVLASWEKLHQVQNQNRTDLWRMGRLASVCLWRYRRERAKGRATHPELLWPDALVVLDQVEHCARSAVLLPNPLVPMALPPVELVVTGTDRSAMVLPAEVLSSVGGEALALGQSQRLIPQEALTLAMTKANTLPVNRFRALGDYDWSD